MNKKAYLQVHKSTYSFGFMTTLAQRLKMARNHARLKQAELAEKAGVEQPLISQIETGKNSQSAHLVRFATICRVNPVWLDTGEGEMLSHVPDYDAMLDQAEAEAELEAAPGNKLPEKASSTADLFRMMLESKAGKALPAEARERLLRAAEEEPTVEPVSGAVLPADFSRSARVVNGDVLIPQYNVRGSMGHGQVVGEYVEFVRNMVVAGSELGRLGLEITSPSNLAIITGWGQSMAPTIQDKDPVVVDRGITSYQDDGIYVITWDNHLFIKRLHKAAGGKLKIISDCRPHDSDTVDPEDIYVHGKVLYIWNGKKA
ncbi:XRE family transcriptional regulator [Pseudomonas paralcaligenes]|uniref:XRE family transcriptional regulator n=1 Tax=Pseudomonas paralcaligenes TaxID=2772558 RepID=UPI001C824D50|nr:XRE family transcriptional regulator [Pseudomonas paralcaligenes]